MPARAAMLWAHLAPKQMPGKITRDRTRRVRRMGDIVNLRTARKRAKRQVAAQTAAANRTVHGRSKAARKLTTARAAKIRRDHDGHRIETGEER
jgi:hypothetical protein